MRCARIIFCAEGTWRPRESDPLPVMFNIDLDYHPTTADQCAPLTDPIRRYLAGPDAARQVEQTWFSEPEALDWQHMAQEIVVDGGTVVDGNRMRFRAELHYSFCNCACCRREDAYLDQSVWL